MGSIIEKYGFYEWVCHTNYSFKVGASHPFELVQSAVAEGYGGLGITDYDGVYGISKSFQAIRSLRKENVDRGLRLFYGAEFHLQKDHDLPHIHQDTLIFLAQSIRGYFNLCRLASYCHREGKIAPTLPLDYIQGHDLEGISIIQPMRGLIHRGGQERSLRERSKELIDLVGSERFFMGVSRHFAAAEDQAILPTIQIANSIGSKCLLTQDVYFHKADRKDLSDLLTSIRLNTRLSESVSHHFVNGERSIHNLRNIESRFNALPIYEESLRASKELAERFSFELDELRYKYPKEMLPPGIGAQEFLEKITWEGARGYYDNNIPENVAELLAHEIKLVNHLQFADYFLTVWDIVRWARSQGILCQGRGSAANSAICFVLGVTAVNPAHFDVLFERFMSVERGDPPDIDVDFEHERREEVIQYIYERYGRSRAALVANVIMFRNRGALRAAGKALGVPEAILKKASGVFDSRDFRNEDAEKTVDELKRLISSDDLGEKKDPPWLQWIRMSRKLQGFPSHLGIHSGGFVIADKSLDWLCAQEPATMPGRTVIQWSKDDIEALNCFKIDMLALGMLTAIRKCFDLIKLHHGITIDLQKIPADDKCTYDMICKADTVGTFQIESRAQISMLPRMKPRQFYDLVIEVAIIRPGPIEGGMINPYLSRREGKQPVNYPDPRLESILKRTLGVPIFQEQVMRIAMAVGGFTGGEANELRRNMGSFAFKGDLGYYGTKLKEGMKANGIPEEFIKTILAQLEGFASYGFPESHAASFALLAYASSYLKCHYPEPFFAALLNSQPMGFYSQHVLIQTAKHLGIKILPICVNFSEWDAKLEESTGGLAIRLGMRMARSLREDAARKFLNRRKIEGSWTCLESFVKGAGLSRIDLTSLASADALRVFGIERRHALWLSEAAPFSDFLEDIEEVVEFRAESETERMQMDFHSTSTSLGLHPTEILKREDWPYPVPINSITSNNELSKLMNGRLVSIFGMVIVRQSPPTAKGMVFATVEDDSGLANLVLTPQIYRKFRHLFDRQAFICVRGRLQRQGDAFSVKVDTIFAPKIREAELIAIGQIEIRETHPHLFEKEIVSTRHYN